MTEPAAVLAPSANIGAVAALLSEDGTTEHTKDRVNLAITTMDCSEVDSVMVLIKSMVLTLPSVEAQRCYSLQQTGCGKMAKNAGSE